MVNQSDDLALLQRFLKTRSPQAREDLILRYVPLVYYVLGRMGISREIGEEYSDLVSRGLLGLIDAVDRFDPSFKTKFSTYATLRIRGEILDHLRSLDWLPRAARKRSREVKAAVEAFWSENHREPTDKEIANWMGIDVAQVRQALSDASRVIISLDGLPFSEEEGDTSFHELVADTEQVDPEEQTDRELQKSQLIAAISQLSEREQLILSLYYYEELTMKEISQVLGVSESRICQLHAKAIMGLQAQLAQANRREDKTGQQEPGIQKASLLDQHIESSHGREL